MGMNIKVYTILICLLLFGIILASGCVQQTETPSGTGQEQTAQPVQTPEATSGTPSTAFIESEEQFKQMSSELCKNEWPDDFRMRSYCQEQQKKGYDNLLRSVPSGLTEEVYNTIKVLCKGEWPKDFRMRAYCEEQQIKGYNNLLTQIPQGMSQSDFDLIKNKCKNDWPKDYRMRAYCEEQQLKGYQALK